MTVRFPTFLALMLGLCLALSSVVSAGMMAPERGSHMREIYEATYGPMTTDLCGEPRHRDHHCPFCHALPEPARLALVIRERAFIPQDDWRAREALQRAARGRNIGHSTRAPPRIA